MVEIDDQFKNHRHYGYLSFLVHNMVFWFSCFFGLFVSILIDESIFRKRLYFEALWSLPTITILIICSLMVIITSIVFYFRNSRFQFTDTCFLLKKKKKMLSIPYQNVLSISFSKFIDLVFSTQISTLTIRYFSENKKRVCRIQLGIDQARFLAHIIKQNSSEIE